MHACIIWFPRAESTRTLTSQCRYVRAAERREAAARSTAWARSVAAVVRSTGTANTNLREAFADCGAFRCGYCTPGQIVSAAALLQGRLPAEPAARERVIRERMSGTSAVAPVIPPSSSNRADDARALAGRWPRRGGRHWTVHRNRLALGGMAPTPLRLQRTERSLEGRVVTADGLRAQVDRELDGIAHPLPGNEWKLEAASGLAHKAAERLLTGAVDSTRATPPE